MELGLKEDSEMSLSMSFEVWRDLCVLVCGSVLLISHLDGDTGKRAVKLYASHMFSKYV
jgi:hypothetical protein